MIVQQQFSRRTKRGTRIASRLYRLSTIASRGPFSYNDTGMSNRGARRSERPLRAGARFIFLQSKGQQELSPAANADDKVSVDISQRRSLGLKLHSTSSACMLVLGQVHPGLRQLLRDAVD